jgi:hypothetical protein
MRARCTYPYVNGYHNYGGRGITVCERWESFENFLADMGERPEGRTLDRNDVNLGYEPGNCRWATLKEQSRNTRTTRWIEYQGERLTVVDWAERLNVSSGSLGRRIRDGWPVERAMTVPMQSNRRPT